MRFNPSRLIKLLELESTYEAQLCAAAIYYTGCGIPILPLVPDTKILPPKRTGINYQSAANTPKTAAKWYGPGGQWEGYGIGIACGREGGVCVVDIDTHGGDGMKSWGNLIEDNNHIARPVPRQFTPTGGEHLLYLWVEGMGPTTAKLGSGLDTRGGSSLRYSSHVVAYPTRVPKGEYRWEASEFHEEGGPGDIEILPPPDWVVKAVAREEESGEPTPDDMETMVGLEQIQRMLAYISPNVGYEEWCNIGMAIHSQHAGADGMDIWDEWSQPGDTYDRGEIKGKWRSFRVGGRIRIGSLFHYARQHGWESTDEDSIKEVRNMKLEMLNTTHSIVMVGGRARVVKEVKPYDKVMPHYAIMATDDFKIMLANEFISSGNNDRPRPLADVWLKWRYRNSHPLGMGMFPKVCPEGWYNTWKGFSYKPKEGSWVLMKDHIANIICSGENEWYQWTLDWMAHAIQDPENPPGTAIVMRGDEGIGKGTLADKFGRLFGYHYRHLNNDAHLTGNFNAHMMDALFIFADEITWGGNRKTAGVLKGLVTERHLLGERKNVDAVSYRNMVRLMIASNSDWVVPADISSRRWFVLDVPNGKRDDIPYFASIDDEFNNGGAEAMMYDLTHREIKADLRIVPKTDALAHQRSQSLPSSLQWWRDCLEAGTIEGVDDVDGIIPMDKLQKGPGADRAAWPQLAERRVVYLAYEAWVLHRNLTRLPASTFYRNLEQVGMKGMRPKLDGIRARHWVIPKWEEAKAIMANRLGTTVEELI